MQKDCPSKSYFIKILETELTTDQKRQLQFAKNKIILQDQFCWDFKKHRFGNSEAELLKIIGKNKIKPGINELRLSKFILY